MKDRCGIIPRPAQIVLGKFGDICIMLPGFKHLYDETGHKPVVVVSKEFASILEGVSYVTPDVVALGWWNECGLARQYAISKYGAAILGKFWDDPTCPPPTPPPNATLTTIQFMGRDIVLAASDWDSYMASQWVAAGFERRQMLEWPLVFDRRSPVREENLRQQFFKTKKPKLLVAISGPGTSPFPAVPEVMNVILKFRNDFEIIDLSRIMATRIYDMLGLYDHAAGIVVNDSAPLHLAGASKTPFIAFINNGGSGSIPRGNCVLNVRYANVMTSRSRLEQVLESWKRNASPFYRIPTGGLGGISANLGGGGNLALATVA